MPCMFQFFYEILSVIFTHDCICIFYERLACPEKTMTLLWCSRVGAHVGEHTQVLICVCNNVIPPMFQFFDEIKIEDPRISELGNKAGQPSPYQILRECLSRSVPWPSYVLYS